MQGGQKELQLWVVSTIDYNTSPGALGRWEGLETFRLYDAATDYAAQVRESNLCPGRAGGGWRTDGQDCWKNPTLGLGVRVHIRCREHVGCRGEYVKNTRDAQHVDTDTQNMAPNPRPSLTELAAVVVAGLESAYKKGSSVDAPRDSAGTYRCARTLRFGGTDE